MVPAAASLGLNGRRRLLLELATWGACVVLLLWHMRAALFLGTASLTHDHLYWGYPVFQFYAESLLAGRLPLWNPFTHGGEPFYPVIMQIRLLDPSSLLVVFGGGSLTDDFVSLYAWDRLLRGLILALGSWLLLRRWAREPATTIALVPILVLSSFYWSTLQQMGVGDQFIYAPWVAVFLFRILEGDGCWTNWLALAVFFGLNLQSYFFSGTALLIAFALAGVIAFRRDLMGTLLATPRLRAKAGVAGLIIVVLGLPNAVLLMESGQFVFPARTVSEVYENQPPRGHQPPYEPLMARQRDLEVRYTFTPDYLVWLDANAPEAAPHDPEIRARYTRETGRGAQRGDPLNTALPAGARPLVHPAPLDQVRSMGLPYGFLYHTGTFSTAWDFIQLLAPAAHRIYANGELGGWGRPSEVFMYVGVGAYVLALLGLLAGAHQLKRVWIVIAGGFAATMLGPEGAVHAFLFYVFPPLWFVRHTSALALFFLLALLYFFVLGADLLVGAARRAATASVDDRRRSSPRPRVATAVAAAAVIAGIAVTMAVLPYPFRFYLFPLGVALLAALWLARRVLPGLWLFGAVLASHLAIVLGFALANADWVSPARLVIALGIPALVWWLLPASRRPAVAGALLVFVVAADVAHYSFRFAHLARGARPDRVLGFTTARRAPEFPPARRVFAEYPPSNPYHQPLRYESLVLRQPAVFTTLLRDEMRQRLDGDVGRSIGTALAAARTNSFLMLSGYVELLRSGSRGAIAEAFAVGQPPLQFRAAYDAIPPRDFRRALRELPDDSVGAWLRHAVMLRPPVGVVPAGIPRRPLLPVPDAVAPPASPPDATRLTVARYDYTSLTADVQAAAPGFVYWADGDDGYWRARLDGQPVPVLRANLNFKAVAVPAGRHELRFTYSPTPFLAAVALFYATIAGAGTAAVVVAGSRFAARPAAIVSVSRA